MSKNAININIDMKVIFIIVLAGLVIFQFMFKDGTVIEKYEKEMNELKIKNNKLTSSNDSLVNINKELIKEIDSLYFSIDSTIAEIREKERKIDSLKYEKGKVTGFVNKLNANGVTSEISKYLNRRD
jgi:peptidoglycan hydrolase CwlO-like protein|tara:strand:- start:2733 stop:3113 length:381 start_codon:yes stop_codon:yes gene_type:complete